MRSLSTGKSRASRHVRISLPTAPVAPVKDGEVAIFSCSCRLLVPKRAGWCFCKKKVLLLPDVRLLAAVAAGVVKAVKASASVAANETTKAAAKAPALHFIARTMDTTSSTRPHSFDTCCVMIRILLDCNNHCDTGRNNRTDRAQIDRFSCQNPMCVRSVAIHSCLLVCRFGLMSYEGPYRYRAVPYVPVPYDTYRT